MSAVVIALITAGIIAIMSKVTGNTKERERLAGLTLSTLRFTLSAAALAMVIMVCVFFAGTEGIKPVGFLARSLHATLGLSLYILYFLLWTKRPRPTKIRWTLLILPVTGWLSMVYSLLPF